jgi:type II secretory pathway pseudopilin PulG
MVKRTLCAVAATLSLVALIAQPALAASAATAARATAATSAAEAAATRASAARVAVGAILADYDGALFHMTKTSSACPNDGTRSNQGASCWWWAANAFMALTSYAEKHPHSAYLGRIRTDLSDTYGNVCGGNCPAGQNSTGTDPFIVNTHGNVYYDDIGWWEQAWLNAYKWTHSKRYLYLAEQLWSYVTAHGWRSGCNGGVIQDSKAHATKDAFANALYLRNSAWLYSITGETRFMTGRGGKGGALADAKFVRARLIYTYGGTPGDSGAKFTIADHLNGCAAMGSNAWLQSQGEMINAWTDMYAAEKIYCRKHRCTVAAAYYNRLADELARTVISDKLVVEKNGTRTWPFKGRKGQARPTVDAKGILSEPCDSPVSDWPYDCKLGNSAGTYQSYLISKGIFERAIYCSNHNLRDSELTTFASVNAASIARLPHFGFLWDSPNANKPVIFATQVSVLDGLNAATTGSAAMC